MFQNDAVRNEYKQQLKDKINITQHSHDGCKQKWQNVCTVCVK